MENFKNIMVNNISVDLKTEISSKEVLELIESSIKDSRVNGIINPYVLNIIFTSRFLLLVSNIKATKEEEDDIFSFYDRVSNDGTLKAITETMEEAYAMINISLMEVKESYEKADQSLAGGLIVLSKTSDKLMEDVNKTKETIENFNFEEVKDVVDFKAAIDGSKTLEVESEN